MSDRTRELVERIRQLEEELQQALAERSQGLDFDLERLRVRFSDEVVAAQRKIRTGLGAYLRGARLGVIVTAPVIYGVFPALVLLDISVTLYQWICFPVYGIARVRRADHVVIDRHRLPYLNAIERLNCAYCGYANGVLAYATEIASRTEQFWCPIKHARRLAQPHRRYPLFLDYGDGEAYRRELETMREGIRQEEASRPGARPTGGQRGG